MSDAFMPAIEALRQRLSEEEKAVAETKKLINKLCDVAGLPQPYSGIDEASTPNISTLRPDTFYGKKLYTAVREYLEMRKAANLGPAETREIYDAIVKGGFQFETADANNAMTGMRSMMRKNSAQFHRLPNNSWGLTAWYENIKASKNSTKESEDSDEESGSDDGAENAEATDEQNPPAASN